MKRFAAILLTLALLVGALPAAFAVDDAAWKEAAAAGEAAGLRVDWYPEYQTITRLFGIDRMALKQNDLFGLFTLEGESVTGCIFDAIGQPLSDGTMVVMKGGKWGRIDKDGNTVLDFIYATKEEAKNPVNVKIVQKGGLFAIADKNGKLLSGYDYWNAREFVNGYAALQNDQGLWGYIDGNGMAAVPFRYYADKDGMGDMGEDGFAIIKTVAYDGWNVVSSNGEELFQTGKTKIWDAGQGMWGFTEDGKVGFANEAGEIVIPAQYVYYTDPKGFLYGCVFDKTGVAKVYTDFGHGAEKRIDTTGAEVPAGMSFDDPIKEGLSRKLSEGKWGFIGADGKEVVPYLYDGVSDFDCGCASVLAGGVYGMLKNPLGCSDWAEAELADAEEGGYITQRTWFYRQDEINRLQFAELAVNYYEKTTGTVIEAAPADTFTDTSDEAVLKAYAAGIVQGTGERLFNPNGILDRQQLATMLYRAMTKAGVGMGESADLAAYADGVQVAVWAEEAMAALVGGSVLQGTGQNRLSPEMKCTVEQAILLVWRSAK